MPFPTTSVLDDFNRANENPLSTAGNWRAPILSGPNQTLKLVSNAVMDDSLADGGSSGQAYWNAATFGPGSEVYVTLPVVWNATNSDVWLWIDGNAEGTTGVDGYKFYTYYNTGVWYYYTVRVDNEVNTELVAGDAGTTPSSGDALGGEHNGSTLTWYRKPSGGSWAAMSDVATASDSTYTSGHIGLSKGYNDTTSTMDDFGGGTIVTASTARRLLLLGVGT